MDATAPLADARRLLDWVWVGLAASAAALALRMAGIGSRDVWLDEIYSQFAISRDWPGLVYDRVSRGHSPFYFGLMKLAGIDPANIVALRIVSACLDAIAAGVLAGGMTRYFGLRAGLFVGLLYTFSPTHVYWAQEARPYGLLMMFTAMGLVGSIGLADTIGRGLDDGDLRIRGPHILFAIGWSGASFSLTGGILAFVVVATMPWWPWLRRGYMIDPTFRSRWRRAGFAPWIVAFLTYMLVSRLHVVDQVGDYWLENYRPFGAESLWLLLRDLTFGHVAWASDMLRAVHPEAGSVAAALVAFAMAALAIVALRTWREAPSVLPIAGLGLGLGAVMLVASLNTSLLLDRYFTPVWMGCLALAGLGLTALRPLPAAAISAPILLLQAHAGWIAATTPTGPRDPDPRRVAEAIDGMPERLAPVVTEPGGFFRTIRMELMLHRLNEPELPRPEMDSLSDPQALPDRLASGAPVFVVARRPAWEASVAGHLGPAPCHLLAGDILVAAVAQPCTAPFGTGPAPW